MPFVFWLLIVIGFTFSVFALISHLFYSVTGTWERVDNAGKTASKERIQLAQFGFIVIGRRVVIGGTQSFFGMSIGQHFWLKRRDYGIASLTREGFPESVAKEVEGSVMGKYHLQLSDDQIFLFGEFTPFRVEFFVTEKRSTSFIPQDPQPRKYKRVECIMEPKEIIAMS